MIYLRGLIIAPAERTRLDLTTLMNPHADLCLFVVKRVDDNIV